MWSFVWEPVVSAGITGALALLGVVVTVWYSGKTTRQRGLDQHNEQNQKLDQLIVSQTRLERKVDINKNVAESGLSDLKGQVGGLMETNNVLFGMIVDLDKKVTKTPNRTKRPSMEDIHP